jgi:hypothetical protein
MILTPEILTLTLLNLLFAFFSMAALLLSVQIVLGWDVHATTQKQYMLEKKSFLGAVIIKYLFWV